MVRGFDPMRTPNPAKAAATATAAPVGRPCYWRPLLALHQLLSSLGEYLRGSYATVEAALCGREVTVEAEDVGLCAL